MKYLEKILLAIISIIFIIPLLSLIIFISQLLHIYLTTFLPGTQPPISLEFFYLFLYVLPISIIIQGILIFFIIFRFNKNKNNHNFFSSIFRSILFSFSFNVLFYILILFPALVFFNIILVIVTLEYNLNVLFSIAVFIGNILSYIFMVILMIFLVNLSTQKLSILKNNTLKYDKHKDKRCLIINFKKNLFPDFKILLLLIPLVIDTFIFSIIFIFIELNFFLRVRDILSLLTIVFFLALVYKELNKFVNKLEEELNISK